MLLSTNSNANDRLDCERFHLDVSRIDRMTARFQPRPSEIAMQDYVPEAATIIIEASTRGNENRLWCLFATPKIHRNGDFVAWWQTRLEIIVSINDAFRICFFAEIFFREILYFIPYYKIIGKNKNINSDHDFIRIRDLNVRLHFEKNPLLNRWSGRWRINCIPINRLARTADLPRESLRTKLLEIGPE